jgi:hypothetical protein
MCYVSRIVKQAIMVTDGRNPRRTTLALEAKELAGQLAVLV